MVKTGCPHALAGPVNIVGSVTVKHAQHWHELAYAYQDTSVLTFHAIGILQIGRLTQGFFDAGSIDLPHVLALELDALLAQVVKDTLRRDKRRAVGVDYLNLDLGANLIMRLASRPQDSRGERNRHDKQNDILYQPFQCPCFLNSLHISGSRLAISPAPAVNKTSKLLKCIDLIKFSFE